MSSDAQKTCPDCLEPLHPKARKCVKCGSFQDFRRFTGQSSVVLSLLIALITVSTFAFTAWRSQNPVVGIDISTRSEHVEEILDVVNTGEVPVNLRSVKLALRFADDTDKSGDYRLITIEEMPTDAELQMTNHVLDTIALRSAGVVGPQKSTALRIEYVPTKGYESEVYLASLTPKMFNGIISELMAKADGLSEMPVACEYLVEYAFVSELVSSNVQSLRVPANCMSTAHIAAEHLKNFCARSELKNLCD